MKNKARMLTPHEFLKSWPAGLYFFVIDIEKKYIYIMSWFKEQKKTSYLRSFCNNVIKSGPLPQHVAIIMDGNRRFAKKVNCERSKGHEKGFEKLTEVRGFMNNFGSLQFTQISFSHTEQHFSVCDAFKLACWKLRRELWNYRGDASLPHVHRNICCRVINEGHCSIEDSNFYRGLIWLQYFQICGRPFCWEFWHVKVNGGGRNRIGRRKKWPKKGWEEGKIGGKSREKGEKET